MPVAVGGGLAGEDDVGGQAVADGHHACPVEHAHDIADGTPAAFRLVEPAQSRQRCRDENDDNAHHREHFHEGKSGAASPW